MSRIYWQGRSDVLKSDSVLGPDTDIVFPLVEEEVLSVAFTAPNRHISTSCALRCTSRAYQRWALRGTGLNPKWMPYPWLPDKVIKAPASCLNNGVSFTQMTEHVEILRRCSPLLSRLGVVEDKIYGEAVEADGARVDGRLVLFPVLSQTWDSESSRILEYRAIPAPSDIVRVVDACLDAVDLENGCFCIELRRTPSWKVIEVHARLGEDSRLSAAWGFDPIDRIEEFVRSAGDHSLLSSRGI